MLASVALLVSMFQAAAPLPVTYALGLTEADPGGVSSRVRVTLSLPTDAEGQQKACRSHSKRTVLRIFAFFALMFVLFSGIRHVSRTARPRCTGGRLHRNMTSLPSHYTLPSGDKIPSVALGMCLYLSTKDWKLRVGQVCGRPEQTRLERQSRYPVHYILSLL